MGDILSFKPEKHICGVLTSRLECIDTLVEKLERAFGTIDFKSEPEQFTYTSYYDAEMGSPIYRFFVSFDDLVAPDTLSTIKTRTNKIEEEFLSDSRRAVNLDPGLLSLQRLVLASTKDNGRRIPLSDGIYAEITLIYVEGDYVPLDWTYPDFRSRRYRDIMKQIRQTYRTQLKQL